jgi:hypothetical protein
MKYETWQFINDMFRDKARQNPRSWPKEVRELKVIWMRR